MQLEFLKVVVFSVASASYLACSSQSADNSSGSKPCKKPATSSSSTSSGSTSTSTGSGTTSSSGTKTLSLADVTYETDVAPIFKAKCTSCHSSTGSGKSPMLDSLADLKTNLSLALSEINSGSMPPSGTKVTSTEVTKINSWVSGGYKSTSSGTSTTPGSTTPSTSSKINYTTHIQPLLTKYCTSCHMAKKTFPDLSTYALAKVSASASLSSMKSKKMPKGGTLPADQLTLFQSWITDGLLEKSTSTPSTSDSAVPSSTSSDAKTGC